MWHEALQETGDDARFRNWLGSFPYGDKMDDPWEPDPWTLAKRKWRNWCEKPFVHLPEDIENF